MKISVAICDDLPGERANLARMLQLYFQNRPYELAAELFGSGAELLATFQKDKFHILFLDIYMAGLSGMETARQIRQQDKTCTMVFATTSKDHGIESFELRASDYLLKPFRQEDVNDALDWCIQELDDQLRSIEIRSERELLRVPQQGILYIEIRAHTALVHTQGSCIQTRRGLDDLEAEIGSGDFLRCHRSFLVNLNYVRRIDEDGFLLKDESKVPIGSSTAAYAKQYFFDWSFIKTWEDR